MRVNNITLRTNPYKVSNIYIYIYRSVTITMIPSIEQSKTISDHILPSRIVRIPLPFPRVAQIDNIISIRRNPLPIPRHTSEWRCYDNYETIGQIESPPFTPILLQQHFQVVRVNNNTLIAKLHRNCTNV